jgi:hypothetical protein
MQVYHVVSYNEKTIFYFKLPIQSTKGLSYYKYRTLQQKLAAPRYAFAIEPYKASHWQLDVTVEFPSL